MKIYQVSGLGANANAFRNLRLEQDFEQVYIPWLDPEKDETLAHYAERLLDKINPTEEFLLMGLSFGGIIVQEMNRFIDPAHTFLISTVKNRTEIPKLFRFSALINAHKIIPMSFLTSDRTFSYMMMRKLYYTDREKDNIDDIFEFKNADYLKWSIHKIVNWEHSAAYHEKNVTHIHGTKDIVFPIEYIKDAIQIDGGTHIMVMQKPKQVSEEINKVLTTL
ncbi:alpha/beta hydrolase [Empedobacter stercoris]|uniref:Alpha/beta hydrolase n=2 Tax=Empedobacter TaxID=59734 RepID=A0ABY8V8Z7_9FLAO|nr:MULTISPECIES: alpha/beta hydrolase [Empedobacter]MCA4776272.1 alpha/beta hydrolase [Empedobacter stercoris]MCA4782069.1 alpha/beta hydrolase [Empedobacter stercoris]MCA4808571.1 alpha/beta hydrolase [Empedobacter stercoris]MDM1522268.1 alpha/beta hydrolase [Empedobacter sp. 225-1]MDM1542068.1 alpha/beta hydrolase [Empedobacter sp. 189-2]